MPARPHPLPAFSRSTPNLSTLVSLQGEPTQQANAIQEGTGPRAPAGPAGPAGPSTAPAIAFAESRSTVSPSIVTSPSEPTSLEDFSLDAANPPSLPSTTSSAISSSEEEEDQEASDSGDDTLPDNLPPPPTPGIYNRPQYSRSNTYLAATFAPPFYNRPPTPLPPSPSLTSLLRPNFSAATSRPSTPDPSSDEGGTATTNTTTNLATGAQTPNSAAATTLSSSFRTAKPIPRASPKVPTYEYYGFTLYLTSSLAFLIYILWSFLPSPFLHQLGIYYYPNRWWSLAIPAWLVMLVVWVFVALASYNTGTLTLAMKDLGCLVDAKGGIAVVDDDGRLLREEVSSWNVDSSRGRGGAKKHKKAKDSSGKKERRGGDRGGEKAMDNKELDWRSLWQEGTDAVLDIPIGGVCEVLYGTPDEDDDDFIHVR